MTTHIYIKYQKSGEKYALVFLLVNIKHTACIITYLNSPPRQSIIFRCLGFLKEYMTKDVIINKAGIIDFSIISIFNYKPKLGQIFTKEEKAVADLHKKHISGGTFKLINMKKASESSNPYIHAIHDIAKRATKFKEIKTAREGEIFTYHMPIK